MTPQDSSASTSTVPAVDARVTRTRRDVLAATVDELVEGGWDAVTHARVAARAGYAKATLYAHWPDRIALVRDAFGAFGAMPHHEPTGDIRADLVGELRSFRAAMSERRLDRALAILAERAGPVPELQEVRRAFVEDGERPLRRLLEPFLSGARLEAVTAMLCGVVVHPVLLRGDPPDDRVIDAAVGLVLGDLEAGSR
jgi:AcrR family transcriptional regulator